MTITLRGATTAVAPGTEIPYNYVAQEDIAEKEVVAKSETTRRILKAQATSWSRMPAFGISRESKVAGETIEILQFGKIENISRVADFNYDDKIFVSTTAGKATSTPPEAVGAIIQSLGRALNASDIILEIDQTVLELLEV